MAATTENKNIKNREGMYDETKKKKSKVEKKQKEAQRKIETIKIIYQLTIIMSIVLFLLKEMNEKLMMTNEGSNQKITNHSDVKNVRENSPALSWIAFGLNAYADRNEPATNEKEFYSQEVSISAIIRRMSRANRWDLGNEGKNGDN
uniref:Uncharacterized protein n=1 Tax=Onchocerca volvulus TaxID=6282 RepID=A0A8R1TVC9_ONCVO